MKPNLLLEMDMAKLAIGNNLIKRLKDLRQPDLTKSGRPKA